MADLRKPQEEKVKSWRLLRIDEEQFYYSFEKILNNRPEESDLDIMKKYISAKRFDKNMDFDFQAQIESICQFES